MDGFRILFVFVVAVVGFGTQAQTLTPAPTGQFFNCGHRGQEMLCQPGTCSANGTSCECGDPTSQIQVQDIHCVPTQDATPCASGKTCSGQGTCLTDRNGLDICFCGQLYAGSDCQIPRAHVTCSPSAMMIAVTSHGSFTGRMYASGFRASGTCQLADDGTGTWTGTFSLVPGQNSTCGISQMTGPEGEEFKAKVRVQYNTEPDLYVATDQELTLTCSFDANVNLTTAVSSVDASEGTLNAGTGQGDGRPLVFDILVGDVALSDDQEVEVGEELTLSLTLQSNPAYQELLVVRCTASNRPPSDNDTEIVSLDIVIDGCPANHSVVAGDHRATVSPSGEPRVQIPVYAFVFVAGSSEDSKNSLHISCLVTLCANGSQQCQPLTCPAGGQGQGGMGRGRREVREETVTVGKTLTVTMGNVTDHSTSREESEGRGMKEDCLRDPHLLSLVVGMGVALLLLLILLLILLIVYLNRRYRRHQKKVVGEEGLSSTPAPSPTTPTTSREHIIPRAKLQ